jgi:hypothetical protein
MVFEPGGMCRITAEASSSDAMMLTSDHAAQSGKVAFGAVDMDAIEEAIGVRVIDPLEVESIRKLVPMRRLVSDDRGTPGNFRFGEAHRLGFVLENVRQRATVALPEDDDAAAVKRPMGSEAPVNAIGARIRRPDVASDISAVDLHRPLENQAFCLGGLAAIALNVYVGGAKSPVRNVGFEQNVRDFAKRCLAVALDPLRKEKRTLHAVGDGTFIVDGRKLDRRKMMASKLPAGL